VLNGPEPKWRRELLLSLGFTQAVRSDGSAGGFRPPAPGTLVRAKRDLEDWDGEEKYTHGGPGAIGVILAYHHKTVPTVCWGNHPGEIRRWVGGHRATLDGMMTHEEVEGLAAKCTGHGVYDVDLVADAEVVRG
jgi:hypothetical protein